MQRARWPVSSSTSRQAGAAGSAARALACEQQPAATLRVGGMVTLPRPTCSAAAACMASPARPRPAPGRAAACFRGGRNRAAHQLRWPNTQRQAPSLKPAYQAGLRSRYPLACCCQTAAHPPCKDRLLRRRRRSRRRRSRCKAWLPATPDRSLSLLPPQRSCLDAVRERGATGIACRTQARI